MSTACTTPPKPGWITVTAGNRKLYRGLRVDVEADWFERHLDDPNLGDLLLNVVLEGDDWHGEGAGVCWSQDRQISESYTSPGFGRPSQDYWRATMVGVPVLLTGTVALGYVDSENEQGIYAPGKEIWQEVTVLKNKPVHIESIEVGFPGDDAVWNLAYGETDEYENWDDYETNLQESDIWKRFVVQKTVTASRGASASLKRHAAMPTWEELRGPALHTFTDKSGEKLYIHRPGNKNNIEVVDAAGDFRGRMHWYPRSGEIMMISARPKRLGVGSEMFRYVKANIEPRLHHSTTLSDDGKKFAPTISMARSFDELDESPLDYSETAWGTVRRLALIESEAGPHHKGDTYFAERKTLTYINPDTGRKVKKPREIITPGAADNTVGFLDFNIENDKTIYINFMQTRVDFRRQDVASDLVAELYRRYPSHRVDWGKLMHAAAGALFREYKMSHPDRTFGGMDYYSSLRTQGSLRNTYEDWGEVGNRDHTTREDNGTVPTALIAELLGVMGEVPGEHRNKQGAAWERFKADISANGITNPIFITVDYGKGPRISEGNHRRDAAVELGMPEVPIQIRYFGCAEKSDDAQPFIALSDTPVRDMKRGGSKRTASLDVSEFGSYEEVLRAALGSWKGDPSGIHLHMSDALNGEPEPSSKSGRQMRAHAEIILDALKHHARPAPRTLYRGANRDPSSLPLPSGWSTRLNQARIFAKTSGSTVWQTPKGTMGIRIADHSYSQLDEVEAEWIVAPEALDCSVFVDPKIAMPVKDFKGTDRNMSKGQVLAACQRILKDMAREFDYDGELPAVEISPYLPGMTEGRSVDPSREYPYGVILLNEDFWLPNAQNKEHGYINFRTFAHEAIHALVQRDEKSYEGITQIITEGGAEVLSIWYWAKNAPAFDDRDAFRVDGKWVTEDALARHLNYNEWIVELMRRTASKVGWRQDAIVREVQRIVSADHMTKINFRDETDPSFPLPGGVSDDAVSLMMWLIAMNKTAMPWTIGPADSTRCTQSVLMQFGIFGVAPRDGGALLQTLTANGWTYHVLDFTGTVKKFYETHPTGKYYLYTPGHALAMYEGLLVDSEGKGPNRRQVQGAWQIFRKNPSERDDTDPIPQPGDESYKLLWDESTWKNDGEWLLRPKTSAAKPGWITVTARSDDAGGNNTSVERWREVIAEHRLMYRGMGVDNGKDLAQCIQQSNHMHWSTRRSEAAGFASASSDRDGRMVMLTAEMPDIEDIITDPDELRRNQIRPYDTTEAEVPIKPGTSIHIHMIEVAPWQLIMLRGDEGEGWEQIDSPVRSVTAAGHRLYRGMMVEVDREKFSEEMYGGGRDLDDLVLKTIRSGGVDSYASWDGAGTHWATDINVAKRFAGRGFGVASYNNLVVPVILVGRANPGHVRTDEAVHTDYDMVDPTVEGNDDETEVPFAKGSSIFIESIMLQLPSESDYVEAIDLYLNNDEDFEGIYAPDWETFPVNMTVQASSLTNDLDLAKCYTNSSGYGEGFVYEVEPQGKIYQDPHYPFDRNEAAFLVRSARITQRVAESKLGVLAARPVDRELPDNCQQCGKAMPRWVYEVPVEEDGHMISKYVGRECAKPLRDQGYDNIETFDRRLPKRASSKPFAAKPGRITVTAAPIKPLMMGDGIYYRLHSRSRPFSPEDARSDVARNGRDDLPKSIREVSGYSCFANPAHLRQYVQDMDWDTNDPVVRFNGDRVGEGYDGEATVMPISGILERIKWDDFVSRIEVTSEALEFPRWNEIGGVSIFGVLAARTPSESSGTTLNVDIHMTASGVDEMTLYRGICLQIQPESILEGSTYTPLLTRFLRANKLGSHWSTDWTVARDFALGQAFLSGYDSFEPQEGEIVAGFVLGARFPKSAVMPRNEANSSGQFQNIFPENSFEKEITIRPGTPIDIEAVSLYIVDAEGEEDMFEIIPDGFRATASSNSRAVETDTELAALYGELAKLMPKLVWAEELVHESANHDFSKGRHGSRVYEQSVDHAINMSKDDFGAWLADHYKDVNGGRLEFDDENLNYNWRELQESINKYRVASDAVRDVEDQIERLESVWESHGWSRFFWCKANGGHIHSSMNCSTCNRGRADTEFGWLPNISGASELEAVEEYGGHLCTVCFRSAPVEWTDGTPGRKLTDDQQAKQDKADERDRKRQEKLEKAILPDGSPLRLNVGSSPSTLVAAQRALADVLNSVYTYASTHPRYAEWIEDAQTLVAALAAKTGEDERTIAREALDKALKKNRGMVITHEELGRIFRVASSDDAIVYRIESNYVWASTPSHPEFGALEFYLDVDQDWGKVVYVRYVRVRPEFRHRGIAKKMLAFLLDDLGPEYKVIHGHFVSPEGSAFAYSFAGDPRHLVEVGDDIRPLATIASSRKPHSGVTASMLTEPTNPFGYEMRQVVRHTLDEFMEGGGVTLDLGGHSPEKGYQVGKPGFGEVVPSKADLKPATLRRWIMRNQRQLGVPGHPKPHNNVGLWADEQDGGKTYIDVSENVPSQGRAVDLAKQRGELAIWDVDNQQEIRTSRPKAVVGGLRLGWPIATPCKVVVD